MRPGVRIGVDVGTVRIGLAASDAEGRLAVPVRTLRRDARGDGDFEQIAALVAERGAIEVVVGLPQALSGRAGRAATSARDYAGRLADRLRVPVRLVDERLSTAQAEAALHAAGVRTRRQRGVVDQAAAVVVLQAALDAERATHRPPGEQVPLP